MAKTKALLTKNQIEFMKATLNYDNRETQLSDNYSNAGIEQGCELFEWNKMQMGGLISSLQQKGMGYHDTQAINGGPKKGGFYNDQFILSELGVNTIFDIIEGK